MGDDVVICVNADTGKTVWKRVFEEQGQNLIYNGNYYAAPIIADGWASASVSQGRVFYRNGTRLMCADFRKE